MGTRYTYHCDKCTYAAIISAGKDMGFKAETNTYLCSHCEELVDVVTRLHSTTEQTDTKQLMVCPICKKSDMLKEWDTTKRLCPKCHASMERSPEGLIINWD